MCLKGYFTRHTKWKMEHKLRFNITADEHIKPPREVKSKEKRGGIYCNKSKSEQGRRSQENQFLYSARIL